MSRAAGEASRFRFADAGVGRVGTRGVGSSGRGRVTTGGGGGPGSIRATNRQIRVGVDVEVEGGVRELENTSDMEELVESGWA